MRNSCPAYIFLLKRNWKIFFRSIIAYDIRVGHNLDLRSFWQVQCHCLKILNSYMCRVVHEWKWFKGKIWHKLACVRRNEIICNIFTTPAQLNMTRLMYFIFVSEKKLCEIKKIGEKKSGKLYQQFKTFDGCLTCEL